MSDVNGLLAAFDAGELLRPSAEVPNIVDLGNAVAGLAGLDGALHTEYSRSIAEQIGPSKHLVLIAADGLGMNAIREMAVGSFIRSHVVTELRTVFPSSTPVVFTSLATGQWPNRHAVIGWYMYLSEIDCVATIIRFESRSDKRQLSKLGLAAEQAYPLPSLMGRFNRATLSLLPEEIAGTAYSTYTGGGTAQNGYKTLHEAFSGVLTQVSSSSEPTFTYLYTPTIDAITHEFGFAHEKVHAAIQELDRETEWLASSLPTGSRILLTADHGLLDAGQEHEHELHPPDELVQLLRREPWGDGRATQFDVRESENWRFEETFRRLFAEDFYLITVADAERLELYGPGGISRLTKERLGNYIAISKGRGTIYYNYPKTEKSDFHMVSHHSGMTPDEMLVPLVVA